MEIQKNYGVTWPYEQFFWYFFPHEKWCFLLEGTNVLLRNWSEMNNLKWINNTKTVFPYWKLLSQIDHKSKNNLWVNRRSLDSIAHNTTLNFNDVAIQACFNFKSRIHGPIFNFRNSNIVTCGFFWLTNWKFWSDLFPYIWRFL